MLDCPQSPEFPKIWRIFEAKDPENLHLIKYRIQNIPEEYFIIVLDQLVQHYLNDEPLSKALDIIHDKTSVEERIEAVRNTLSKNLSIGCFKENSSELVGFQILTLIHKDDPKIVPTGQMRLVQFNLHQKLMNQADIFNKYEVERFLGDYGLSVDPKYRGLGIATELLKARIQVAKSMGLITSGGFSSIASQRAALKAGFVVDTEIKVNELSAINFKTELTNLESVKILSAIPH